MIFQEIEARLYITLIKLKGFDRQSSDYDKYHPCGKIKL